jgi:hypothetical protein
LLKIRQKDWLSLLNSQPAEILPIPQERLQRIHVPYWTFDDHKAEGKIEVLDVVVPWVKAIFEDLLNLKFPIFQICPIEDFGGSDVASMDANNTSAFNGRKIDGSSLWSLHAYGLAIDLNPFQNPFLSFDSMPNGLVKVLPYQGTRYLNRSYQRPGMVEPIISVFKKHGFTVWGGAWNQPIDYHHFQITREFAEILAICTYEEGQKLFQLMIDNPLLLNDLPFQNNAFLKAYETHSTMVIEQLMSQQTFLFLTS